MSTEPELQEMKTSNPRVRSAALISLLAFVAASCAPSLPTPELPASLDTLDQQWSKTQRAWFHHASQGTATFGIPYEWFMALPAPELFSNGLLSDTAYLSRFGFIPSAASLPDNPDGLPIGFAKGARQVDPRTNTGLINPVTGKMFNEIGLTCAACHTGLIIYRGTAVTIDGGSAMLDLGKLRTAVGIAILRTAYFPGRLDRFADKVLGVDAPAAARNTLRQQFEQAVAGVNEQISLDQHVADASVEEGFGRLDALNRIGNEVFAKDMRDGENRPARANYAPTNAPVHFPHIWDSPWFSWAQYSSSIQQPMVRNAGEAMGVSALVNLSQRGQPLYTSSVNFDVLNRIEHALSGPYSPGSSPQTEKWFSGLIAPSWPESFPPIDTAAASRGSALYANLCANCHLPAIDKSGFWDNRYWQPAYPQATARYLDLPLIPISEIGTDPGEAQGLATRTVTIPGYLNIKTQALGPALGQVVENVAQHWYDGQSPPLSPVQREKMNGSRPNGIRSPMSYRTRPLDGIWAAPPYLHNGSVPSLYDLLSPVSERPVTFWLGSRDFDPEHVGYSTSRLDGGFLLDTRKAGNSNRGHEFDNRPIGNGVIGRLLSPRERLDLVEYLKTLKQRPSIHDELGR